MTIATHPQQIADTTTFEVNQELQNYRGRIVAGSSVQEFNDIIDQLLVWFIIYSLDMFFRRNTSVPWTIVLASLQVTENMLIT